MDNIDTDEGLNDFLPINLPTQVEHYWYARSITQILDRQEYIGDTVNFKYTTRSFKDKVKKYTEIKELTPEIINELIDKILVYQQTKLNGKKFQQIDIYYTGVGIIGIPLTEYELENAFQQSIKNIKTA